MADDDKKEEAEAKGGGSKKLIIIIVPVVLILVAAAYFLFLKPKDDTGAPKALPEPVPGAVVTLDPITVNLAGGHFLKLGLALQPIAGGHEAPDGSKALDLAISQFSGMSIEALSEPEGREEAKEELIARVKLSYLPHDEKSAAELTRLGVTMDPGKVSKALKTPAQLSGAAAIKKAHDLTIQTEVYEVFFTEFVMQ